MQQDSFLSFDLPAVARKKVSIGFDGGLLSSDAGVLLLRGVEQRLSSASALPTLLSSVNWSIVRYVTELGLTSSLYSSVKLA
jgi:hypothetical protein